MKKLIMMAMIATCLALCAAVWPQAEMVGETPTQPQAPAIAAPKAVVAETEMDAEAMLTAEEEKTEPSQTEPPQENTAASEPAPTEPPAVPEIQPSPEPKPVQNPAPEPASAQTEKELQPGDMVYVASFGWVPYEGPNHCEDGPERICSGPFYFSESPSSAINSLFSDHRRRAHHTLIFSAIRF